MIDLPPVPNEVKHINHFLKVADEHDERNIVISYWCRMYACQTAMKSIPGKKPPAVTKLLVAIMDWLEQTKEAHSDSDGIINNTAAQALVEEYAVQLFEYANKQDQDENFGKNVVKAFYTAGILMDVLQQFEPLSDDIFNKRKYAKWKAAYIHNCLKNGEKPFPGPPVVLDDEDDEDEDDVSAPDVAPKESDRPVVPTASIPISPPSSTPADHEEGSVPFVPAPTITPPIVVPPQPSTVPAEPAPGISSPSGSLGPEQIEKAQKYCKWAGSALIYDDINTAIDNLQRALHLLQFGEEK